MIRSKAAILRRTKRVSTNPRAQPLRLRVSLVPAWASAFYTEVVMSADVAVLFARADSVYKTLPGCDVWDADRDARNWPGGAPVVAHPPCKRWSMINGVVLSRYPHKAQEFAWGNDGGLFALALHAVRAYGGVLEHPAGSKAFGHFGLPRVGRAPDDFGGWTTEVRQVDFGHRAIKRTWLYIVDRLREVARRDRAPIEGCAANPNRSRALINDHRHHRLTRDQP